MFVRLFYTLRKYGVPVSTRELIDLNRAVSEGLVFADQDDFYQLVKTVMVKDERFFDKFDRAMKDYFEGIHTFDIDDLLNKVQKLPKDWFDLELLEKHHVNAVLIGEAMMKSHDKRHTLEVLKGIDEED